MRLDKIQHVGPASRQSLANLIGLGETTTEHCRAGKVVVLPSFAAGVGPPITWPGPRVSSQSLDPSHVVEGVALNTLIRAYGCVSQERWLSRNSRSDVALPKSFSGNPPPPADCPPRVGERGSQDRSLLICTRAFRYLVH